jgi:hypothetical protein
MGQAPTKLPGFDDLLASECQLCGEECLRPLGTPRASALCGGCFHAVLTESHAAQQALSGMAFRIIETDWPAGCDGMALFRALGALLDQAPAYIRRLDGGSSWWDQGEGSQAGERSEA